VDILESTTVEIADQFVLTIVETDREALLRRDGDGLHVIVRQANEPFRLDPILGEIAVVAIARLLDFLL
jgi:hypothetical protein